MPKKELITGSYDKGMYSFVRNSDNLFKVTVPFYIPLEIYE